jgi:predicted metalloprotease with PDZ domain
MKTKTKFLLLLFIISSQIFSVFGQNEVFRYELDLTKKNDAFNVTLQTPQLSSDDQVYSFVSYAPGVHQPLDFGRFIKMFKVYDKEGQEIITNKISTNEFRILEPEKAVEIRYEIDDSFDMNTAYHPIYPMSGTGITDHYTIVNTHGVFGYFKNLKNNPIELKLKLEGEPKVGTALNKNSSGIYEIDSYYHFTDSPLLIGDSLTYASMMVDEIKVEAYVHSTQKINAQMVLDQAAPILNAAKAYIGYSPVERYTFLMYFSDEKDLAKMPVFRFGGALEHSLSSTYALSAKPEHLPFLKDIIAHEFMHILSPLHLHSNILANFDYSNPVSDDMHVWLYEGVTEWVSYIMQVKSGLVSPEDYLNYLSKKINNSMNYDTDYSLTRISREWSTDEGNKQYGNIYQLGALTAAMLDIRLLELSNGERGLREVYLDLIKKFGKDNPFDNGTFFEIFVDMTYPEIKDFIDDHIIKNTPFDFKEEMKKIGVSYIEKQLNPDNIPTMGINIGPDENGKGIIVSLTDDYNGALLKKGDRISHVNDTELNMHTYSKIMEDIKKLKVGDTYSITIIREGKELQITEKLYPKHDTHMLIFDADASDQELDLRKKVITHSH